MHRVRNRLFSFLDLALLPLAPLLAFVVRFEGFQWSPDAQTLLTRYLLAGTAITLTALFLPEIYPLLWRHASIADLKLIVGARVASAPRPITAAFRS